MDPFHPGTPASCPVFHHGAEHPDGKNPSWKTHQDRPWQGLSCAGSHSQSFFQVGVSMVTQEGRLRMELGKAELLCWQIQRGTPGSTGKSWLQPRRRSSISPLERQCHGQEPLVSVSCVICSPGKRGKCCLHLNSQSSLEKSWNKGIPWPEGWKKDRNAAESFRR